MFEFLFHYSPAAFRKGEFVLVGAWPAWALILAVTGAAAGLAWWTWRKGGGFAPGMTGWRPGVIWALQSSLAALLLLLLWQPALRVATLKAQQNIVAVVVDDSRSMAIEEGGVTRSAQAVGLLNDGLLDALSQQYQVRLYRMGGHLDRIGTLEGLDAGIQSTRIGDGLRQIVAESASLPIGAVVLLSDGADNAGGIDAGTIAEVRGRRIPVHTVGFGRERFLRDVEIGEVQTLDRALEGSRVAARVTVRQSGYGGERVRLTVREGGRVIASAETGARRTRATIRCRNSST